MNLLDKRELFIAGIGLGAALNIAPAFGADSNPAVGVDDLGHSLARPAPKHDIPVRKAKTTKLFLTPPGWPNGITADPLGRGFWVGEQRHDNKQEAVWLLDWNGKILHKLMTNAKDTSGIAYGDGCIWSGSVGESIKGHGPIPTDGVFQTDMNSNQVSHRQIPFGPKVDGGQCHGLAWQDGKLWIDSNRLGCLVRIDPKTWQTEYMFQASRMPIWSQRLHGIEVRS